MKAGDLVFVRSKGIIPSLIRFFDKGRFSHVAIAYSDTEILEAEYNTRVHVIPMPEEYKDFEVVPLHLGENNRIVEFSKDYIGKKYDFLEIFRIWFRKVFKWRGLDRFNDTREVVCSELVGDYLEFVGIAEKGTELMAPNELYKFIKSKGY